MDEAPTIESLQRELKAIVAHFNNLQQAVVHHTVLLERIRDEVQKLSRGLGVY